MLAERPAPRAGLVEPDLRLERLRETALLVGRMAGEAPSQRLEDRLAETARSAVRLADLTPVARRRYDALATETATVARVGLALLLELAPGPGLAAAAARLADEMRAGISRMSAVLG